MIDEPDQRTIAAVFRAVASARGEAVAIEVPAGAGHPQRQGRTYAALWARAQALATAILAREPEAGEIPIALFLPRWNPDLVAAQIAAGILGRPWLALEPSLPDPRLAEIVGDSQASILLCDQGHRDRAEALGPAILAVETVGSAGDELEIRATASSAAYLIYTSGTTGKPKGVVIEEASLVNLVLGDRAEFGLGPGDRVAQGSSAAYDSQVEEVWLALAAGATLVVLDHDHLRLGPDLPALLRAEGISVFCPPPTILRGMACADPRAELPALRLLYVGGEALPGDLARAWAPGRRLENGYGPTECTVTVMRTTIGPDDPVTIGRPVPGNRALVLDAELNEVAPGQVGELCLAGRGLARGYLRRPELDAERFPVHARHGRIYRSGDLVRVDEAGRHHYLGRADAQVKIRGHRIELEEVEARLAAEPTVREAACRVQGGNLVAWLVAEDDLDLDRLRRRLETELPEPMRPSAYGRLAELPRNTGGKLDRAALPALTLAAGTGVLAEDERVALVQEAFAAVLQLAAPPAPEADFFVELGGHSLAAALVVSRLREDRRGRGLSVRQLYDRPTAAGLAIELGRERSRADTRDVGPREVGRPRLLTLAQGVLLLLVLVAGSALASALLQVLPGRLLEKVDLFGSGLRLIGLTILLGPLLGLTSILLTLILKWTLVGRYRAGRQAAFGGFHLRHWLVRSAAATIPFAALRDTGLDRLLLRLLGARVGRNLRVGRGVDLLGGGWDLLEIGDDVVLGRDAALRPVRLEDGGFRLGEVVVGAGARLETRAMILGGGRLEADAALGPLALVDDGQEIPAAARAEGVPARVTGTEPAAAATPTGWSPLRQAVTALGSRALLAFLLWSPGLGYGLWLAARLELDAVAAGLRIRDLLGSPARLGALALSLAALLAIDLGLRLLLVRALGRIAPGRHPARSWAALRHDLVTGLVEGAGRTLSGTMFWPTWLRLAGMKIGRGCEISSIMDLDPDLVTIGAGSFFADGIYLGGPRQDRLGIDFAPLRCGGGVFLGNHVVLPGGSVLPDDVLLGIATTLPAEPLVAGESWFGNPPFRLPRREPVTVDRRLTHEPSPTRVLTRAFWEGARFLLPLPPTIVLLAAYALLERTASLATPMAASFLLAPLVFLAAALTMLLTVLAAKWLLLGRTRPGRHPLWSCWCSRWDFLYVLWQRWALPILRPLDQSLLLAPWLRAMGVRLGRRVLLGSGFAQVVDPDMLVIEDEATVEGLFQAHSFEDRVLRTEPLRIGRRASTGAGSIMLQGSELGAAARLAPQSLAMKRERLEGGARHLGCPSAAVDEPER